MWIVVIGVCVCGHVDCCNRCVCVWTCGCCNGCVCVDIWIVVMCVGVCIGVVMDVCVCGYWCGNGCVCVLVLVW